VAHDGGERGVLFARASGVVDQGAEGWGWDVTYPHWLTVTTESKPAIREAWQAEVSGMFATHMDEEREELMRENAAMRAQLDARVKVRAVGGGA
jgi:hypothetical protein